MGINCSCCLRDANTFANEIEKINRQDTTKEISSATKLNKNGGSDYP